MSSLMQNYSIKHKINFERRQINQGKLSVYLTLKAYSFEPYFLYPFKQLLKTSFLTTSDHPSTKLIAQINT